MGLVLDELTENDQNLINDNEVKIVFDPKLTNYLKMETPLTIDFRRDRYGEGFVILGGSSC